MTPWKVSGTLPALVAISLFVVVGCATESDPEEPAQSPTSDGGTPDPTDAATSVNAPIAART